MKHPLPLLTAGICIALASTSAQAGVKERLQSMKNKLKGNNTEQTVEATPKEYADCRYFLKDQADGKIVLTSENVDYHQRCTKIVNGDKSTKTLEPVEVQGQRQTRPTVDKERVKRGAETGAGIGAIVGGFMGIDPRLGAGIGALIGGGITYKKQIKDAREVESAANAAGMKASVKTENTTVKGKQVEKLQGVVIEYPKADMDAQGEKVQILIDRMASLASKAKNNLTFTFEGSAKTCLIPLDQLRAKGVLARHSVVDLCGKSSQHRITITPIPDVE